MSQQNSVQNLENIQIPNIEQTVNQKQDEIPDNNSQKLSQNFQQHENSENDSEHFRENGSTSKLSNSSKKYYLNQGISLIKSIKNIRDNKLNILKIPQQNLNFRKLKKQITPIEDLIKNKIANSVTSKMILESQEYRFNLEDLLKQAEESNKFEDICNWEDFYQKIEDSPELEFPSSFLEKEIDMKSWNNIPIPIMNTTETFEKSFSNICNILYEIINQQQFKFKTVTEKLFQVQNNYNQISLFLETKIQDNQKLSQENLLKMFKKSNQSNMENQKKLEYINIEIQKDREYLDSRLKRIDDSSVIREWAERLVQKNRDEVTMMFNQKIDDINKNILDIRTNNLLAPDLIGPELKYKNLQEFIQDNHKQFVALQTRFEPYVETTVRSNMQIAKNFTEKTRQELKDLINYNNKELHNELAEFNKRLEQTNRDLESKEEREKCMIDSEHFRLETKILNLINLNELNLKTNVSDRMDAYEKSVNEETRSLKDHISNIKKQVDLKYIEDQKELSFQLGALERKCQAFTKNQINTYSEQLKGGKDTINKQSSSSRAGAKKSSIIPSKLMSQNTQINKSSMFKKQLKEEGTLKNKQKRGTVFIPQQNIQLVQSFLKNIKNDQQTSDDEPLSSQVQSDEQRNEIDQKQANVTIEISQLNEIGAQDYKKQVLINNSGSKSSSHSSFEKSSINSNLSIKKKNTIKNQLNESNLQFSESINQSFQNNKNQSTLKIAQRASSPQISQKSQKIQQKEAKNKQQKVDQTNDNKQAQIIQQEQLFLILKQCFSFTKAQIEFDENTLQDIKNIRQNVENFIYEALKRQMDVYLQQNTDIDPTLIAILKSYGISVPSSKSPQNDVRALSKNLQSLIQDRKTFIELNKPYYYVKFKDSQEDIASSLGKSHPQLCYKNISNHQNNILDILISDEMQQKTNQLQYVTTRKKPMSAIRRIQKTNALDGTEFDHESKQYNTELIDQITSMSDKKNFAGMRTLAASGYDFIQEQGDDEDENVKELQIIDQNLQLQNQIKNVKTARISQELIKDENQLFGKVYSKILSQDNSQILLGNLNRQLSCSKNAINNQKSRFTEHQSVGLIDPKILNEVNMQSRSNQLNNHFQSSRISNAKNLENQARPTLSSYYNRQIFTPTNQQQNQYLQYGEYHLPKNNQSLPFQKNQLANCLTSPHSSQTKFESKKNQYNEHRLLNNNSSNLIIQSKIEEIQKQDSKTNYKSQKNSVQNFQGVNQYLNSDTNLLSQNQIFEQKLNGKKNSQEISSYKNDMGLTVKQTGIKTMTTIPGFVGGLLQLSQNNIDSQKQGPFTPLNENNQISQKPLIQFYQKPPTQIKKEKQKEGSHKIHQDKRLKSASITSKPRRNFQNSTHFQKIDL